MFMKSIGNPFYETAKSTNLSSKTDELIRASNFLASSQATMMTHGERRLSLMQKLPMPAVQSYIMLLTVATAALLVAMEARLGVLLSSCLTCAWASAMIFFVHHPLESGEEKSQSCEVRYPSKSHLASPSSPTTHEKAHEAPDESEDKPSSSTPCAPKLEVAKTIGDWMKEGTRWADAFNATSHVPGVVIEHAALLTPQLRETFELRCKSNLESIVSSLEGDRAVTNRLLHRLKGAASTCGAARLSECVYRVECQAVVENTDLEWLMYVLTETMQHLEAATA
ncbi:hypothetical protein AB1Y20_012676 [Prymnesium parvum]|uniref:HPt domain-containing protein n=1 Tax=Prymnesium parvum TaxID=97485 RepID=A0AB34IIJ8_PRYPA